MNDKRDEVKGQVEDALDGLDYDGLVVGAMADFALSREAELQDHITQLKADLATAKQKYRCAETGLTYAFPALQLAYSLRDRFSKEDAGHIETAYLQVRRSQKDLLDLAQQTLDKIRKE